MLYLSLTAKWSSRTCIYISFFWHYPPFCSIKQWLDIVHCALQQDLTAHWLQVQALALNIPQSQSFPHLLPPICQPQICFPVKDFLFCREVLLCHVLDSRSKGHPLVFLSLVSGHVSLSRRGSSSICVPASVLLFGLLKAASYSSRVCTTPR